MKRKLLFCAVLSLSWLVLSQSAIAQDLVEGPAAIEAAFQGSSGALTDLAVTQQSLGFTKSGENREVPNYLDFALPLAQNQSLAKRQVEDPLRQKTFGSTSVTAPLLSFDGTSDDDNAAVTGSRIVPPDTNGDVGRKYFAQMNNIVFEIFNKRTGASVLGPLPNNIFWAGTGSICELTNSGDPIVLYDHQRRRWIFSQFALVDEFGNGHQCFAVSQTSDPLGSYFLYDYIITPAVPPFAGINDYPKISVWRDGLYATFNEFAGGFLGASVVAFDKQAMYNGAPAAAVKVLIPFTGFAPAHFSLQAAHWEGWIPPKRNAPAIIVQAFDDETWGFAQGNDGYWHWSFEVDFVNPANSVFTDLGLIPSAGFDANLCNFGPCIEQPAPGELLDTLAQFTMYRAQYRNFLRYESIVVSHSVDADGADTGGVRWAELRRTRRNPDWALHQAGTFAPDDGENRWMPSIAQDRKGNIAIGYNVSSATTFPSIRYAGHGKRDALGEMGGEQECIAGTGAQIDSANRWADYASMSVDPIDGCTFYFTTEYYENTNSFDFNTRVCAFHFDNCFSLLQFGHGDDDDDDDDD